MKEYMVIDNNLLLSIVVPVYNVEDYLEECVNSILKQQFQQFELILVDDGSPDNCPVMCDIFATQDSRVKVIHKDNGGLSSARNAAISIAKGKYLCFVDSDDIVRNNALLDIAASLHSNPDILITEMYNTLNVNSTDLPDILYQDTYSNDKDAVFKFVFREKENTWASVQYIVKKSLVINNGLYFDIGFYHEDVSWTSRIFTVAQSFAYFNKVWYIRRLGREGSITSTVSPKRTVDMLTLVTSQMNSELYNILSDSQKKVLFNQLVRAMFSSFVSYNRYSTVDKKIICELIIKNISCFDYALFRKHKAFVLMMKLTKPNAALKVYCTFFGKK